MKYAKNKPIGDFVVTVLKPIKNGKAQICIDGPECNFEADLFWLDESSYKPDGEAHLHTTFKGTTPFTVEISLRSEVNHLRINSVCKGGLEPITWR